MKILPMMHKGIVFVHDDGKTFEVIPLQIFVSKNNMTVIRIGNNTIWFDKDGGFDGTESKLAEVSVDGERARLIQEAFEIQGENRGLAPETPYFPIGTPAYEAETRSWPDGAKETDVMYNIAVRSDNHKKH